MIVEVFGALQINALVTHEAHHVRRFIRVVMPTVKVLRHVLQLGLFRVLNTKRVVPARSRKSLVETARTTGRRPELAITS